MDNGKRINVTNLLSKTRNEVVVGMLSQSIGIIGDSYDENVGKITPQLKFPSRFQTPQSNRFDSAPNFVKKNKINRFEHITSTFKTQRKKFLPETYTMKHPEIKELIS